MYHCLVHSGFAEWFEYVRAFIRENWNLQWAHSPKISLWKWERMKVCVWERERSREGERERKKEYINKCERARATGREGDWKSETESTKE